MVEYNNLKKNFNIYLDEWKKHTRTCLHHSTTQPMLDCDAYKQIISMGFKVLPLLKRLYDKDSSTDFELDVIKAHGIVRAVRDIVGEDFQIPEEIRGNIPKMENYTKNWLNKNMNNYLKR